MWTYCVPVSLLLVHAYSKRLPLETSTTCVDEASDTFRSGLKLDSRSSATQATKLCELRSQDHDAALTHAKCLVVTWYMGDVAKAGCGVGVDRLEEYTSCMLNSCTWLKDDCVSLCTAGDYSKAEARSACIEQPYLLLRSGLRRDNLGTDAVEHWDYGNLATQAAEICEFRGQHVGAASKHARCLVDTWNKSDKVKEGCRVRAEILGDYTHCIDSCGNRFAKFTLSKCLALCTAGKYHEVEDRRLCGISAGVGFYELRLHSDEERRLTEEICELRGQDREAAELHGKCVVKAIQKGGDGRDVARWVEICGQELGLLPDYMHCLDHIEDCPNNDECVALCAAGEFSVAERMSDCVHHVETPFQFDPVRSRSEQAAEICKLRGYNVRAAYLHASCLTYTWSMSDTAVKTCDLDAEVVKFFIQCFARVGKWAEKNGVKDLDAVATCRKEAFCSHGVDVALGAVSASSDFAEAQSASEMIATDFWYHTGEVRITNWDNSPSEEAKASAICSKVGLDNEKALDIASCVVQLIGDLDSDDENVEAFGRPGLGGSSQQPKKMRKRSHCPDVVELLPLLPEKILKSFMAKSSDKTLILAIVKQNPEFFKFAPASLQGDKDLVLTALAMNYAVVIQYVAEPFKTELELVLSDHSEKSVSSYVAVMQTLPIRSEAEWKAMQQKACSADIPGSVGLSAHRRRYVGLAHRYRNAYCDGKEDEYVTKDAIDEGHGVCLDHACYDDKTLLKWLETRASLPHNKEPMEPKHVQWLMTRPEPWPAATAGTTPMEDSTFAHGAHELRTREHRSRTNASTTYAPRDDDSQSSSFGREFFDHNGNLDALFEDGFDELLNEGW